MISAGILDTFDENDERQAKLDDSLLKLNSSNLAEHPESSASVTDSHFTLPSSIVKRPREKLESVLKESHHLLRRNLGEILNNQTKEDKPKARRLDQFVDKLRQRNLSTKQSAVNILPTNAKYIPEKILAKKPKLSSSCSATDELQFEFSKNAPLKARLRRSEIVPKIKPPSISKLNEMLDQKICSQKISERNTFRMDKADEINENFGKEIDQFSDFEEKEEDPDSDNAANNPMEETEGSRVKPRLWLESESEDEEELPNINAALALQQQSVTKTISNSSPVKAKSPEAEECLTEDENEDTEGDSDREIMLDRMANLLDVEAEDEESEVSMDEFDEAQIENELKESKFMVDQLDDDEAHGVETTIAAHQELLHKEDSEELEMFMNRFLPDDYVKSKGKIAQLHKKYSDHANDTVDSEVKASSTYGRWESGLREEATTVNVEFQKLLQSDMALSESEEETISHLQSSHMPSDQEVLEENVVDLINLETLQSSYTINKPSSLPKNPFQNITSLESRLSKVSEQTTQPAKDELETRKTFDTISARPKIDEKK